MLDFLRESGKPSERKLRLFAVACCRRAWDRLDADGRAVVEASERLADGAASAAEVMAAVWASRGCLDIDARSAVDAAAVGAWRLAAALLAAVCSRRFGTASCPADPSALDRERLVQADLLRCVFGPEPFGTPGLDPRWRTPLVRSLARSASDDRLLPSGQLDPARLAVLADAVEEAGCSDPAILDHLRSPGPHVRGCHSVDAILATE
jgi:hypothetical protein